MCAEDRQLTGGEPREDPVGHVDVGGDPHPHAALTAFVTALPIRFACVIARVSAPEKVACSIQNGTLNRKYRRVPTTKMSMKPLPIGSPRTPSLVSSTRNAAASSSDCAAGATRRERGSPPRSGVSLGLRKGVTDQQQRRRSGQDDERRDPDDVDDHHEDREHDHGEPEQGQERILERGGRQHLDHPLRHVARFERGAEQSG